ncbi:hypothetical protein D3C76_1395440 [compost metagenome]
MADTTGGVDGGGVDHFRVEFDEKIVGEQRFTDRRTLAAQQFFERNNGHQTIHCLTLKMFLRTLNLSTFAIQ